MATWYENLNEKYGISAKAKILANGASDFFGKFVEPGKAVVNILGATGIAGFKFHVPETEQVRFESDITDHYTDLNENFQDHIALRPITITLTGLEGEYFYSNNIVENTLSQVNPTLRLVEEYLPKITDVVKTIKDNMSIGDSLLPEQESDGSVVLTGEVHKGSLNAVDLFKMFQDLYKFKTAQARAFFYLEALWEARQTFSVETTWKRYDDMVIQSLIPVRDKNADITDFSVTFKQVKFTSTQSIAIEDAVGRRSMEETETVEKIEKGQEVTIEQAEKENANV